MPMTSDEDFALNWATTDIDEEGSLGPVNWDALVQYAIDIKGRRDGNSDQIKCWLSSKYNKGGLNLVRRIDFQDGTRWVARIQLHKPTPCSTMRLLYEVYTLAVVRERSDIPVPEVHGFEANCDNAVAVPFMVMQFIPGDTVMDSFGGYGVHKGKIPSHFKAKFHAAMADIQVQMSAIRFPLIGSVVKCPDGTYSVGPLPGIGGPFDSAKQFFLAWAESAAFPYHDGFVRERTPPGIVDEVLRSIRDFPSRLKDFTRNFRFREGPFPLFHPDFYGSNIIIDSQDHVLSVIDWENAFVAPWEMVEFAKDLSIVPPVMDGPFYMEDEATLERLAERRNYVELARRAEKARGLDSCMSTTLADPDIQNLAHAIWLYQDGRIGFYVAVLDRLESRHH